MRTPPLTIRFLGKCSSSLLGLRLPCSTERSQDGQASTGKKDSVTASPCLETPSKVSGAAGWHWQGGSCHKGLIQEASSCLWTWDSLYYRETAGNWEAITTSLAWEASLSSWAWTPLPCQIHRSRLGEGKYQLRGSSHKKCHLFQEFPAQEPIAYPLHQWVSFLPPSPHADYSNPVASLRQRLLCVQVWVLNYCGDGKSF